MSNYFNQTDYGKNRHSSGIVYSGADKDYELTKDQFLESDSGLTEAEYDYWKNWSDEDYKAEDRVRTYLSRRTLAIDQFDDTVLISENTVEEIALERLEPHKNPYTIENAMAILDSCLTMVQKERYLLNKRDGLSTYEIAALQGVVQRTVMDSIELAEKNILDYLASHTS